MRRKTWRRWSRSVERLRIVAFDETHHLLLLGPLTELLHRAYAPLAAKGLRYVATHQPPERTLRRLAEGFGFLVFAADELIGTATLYPPKAVSESSHYQKPTVYSFGQFAIEPRFQGLGVGAQVMEFLEAEARRRGATELALDTSVQATHLIDLYRRRGYEVVEEVQWAETNYRSVIMRLRL